jgi:hypothetical protein
MLSYVVFWFALRERIGPATMQFGTKLRGRMRRARV